MTEHPSAWDDAIAFLNEYGANWPTEATRLKQQLRGSEENAAKLAHLNRIIECLVRFHFPGRSN